MAVAGRGRGAFRAGVGVALVAAAAIAVPVTARAALVIDPTAVDFGSLEVGTEGAPTTVGVADPSARGIRAYFPTVDTNFAIVANSCDGSSNLRRCTVDVRFEPDVEGAHSTVLRIEVTRLSASGSRLVRTQDVPLSGTGTDRPDPAIPDAAAAVGFPIAALALFAGAFALRRRRAWEA